MKLRIDNPIILRDWRAWRRRWWRKPFVWLAAATLAIQFAVAFDPIRVFGSGVSMRDVRLVYEFAVHAMLMWILPIAVMRYTNSQRLRREREDLMTTPIPDSQVFWAFWARSLAPVAMILAAFWLFLSIPLGDMGLLASPQPEAKIFLALVPLEVLGCALMFAALALVDRSLRVGPWICLLLVVYSGVVHPARAWGHMIQWLDPEYANQFNPGDYEPRSPWNFGWPLGIWAPYFFAAPYASSAVWSCAVGVWHGLRTPRAGGGGILRPLFWSSIPELLAVGYEAPGWITSFFGRVDFLGIPRFAWEFPDILRSIHFSGLGVIVLGLKWNAILWMARRPLPSE